ncbi:prepilin-type N-terminal cleavage/methylation domain-containing protein [Thalassotalea crassostreae]|uniref:prepilin-type N-terminal cleavage/methylation domain-containing protein n=1 Tax=Thalassotalea crassostreae TaxID=1763536 RepID=UPI000837B862|nr:prepilin-type N-terminal cleavage/methylation domain-containing protein [Thalassotalea crassostreae]
MSNNKGFTLIELVIVIVILGILAATAAPKFIDLTGDARSAVMEGVEGSVNSATEIVHAKALIEGQTAENGTINIGDTPIELTYGYPTNASIELAVEISDDAITFDASGAAATWTHSEATGANCNVTYDSSSIANTETRPTITSVTEASGAVEGC